MPFLTLPHLIMLPCLATVLACRLQGLAVCRTWLGALSDLPFPTITLYCQDDGDYWDNWKNHYDVGKVCQWIIMKQPTVTELYQQSPLELSDHAIHSLQRKVG